MENSKDSSMSIGDFAQSLFEQKDTNTNLSSSKRPSHGNVPDISDVEVIQESVDNVLSSSFGVNVKKEPKENLEEARQLQLKEEVLDTIQKLKSLLSEMSPGATFSVGSGIFNNPNYSNASNKSNKNPKRRKTRRKKV